MSSLTLIAACGGPKTEEGVAYDAISASDIETACKTIVPREAMAGRALSSIPDREKKKALNQCCGVAKKSAAKLSDVQRAFLYNQWMGRDNITQTQNQVQVFRDREDALARDLTTAQRIEAAAIRPTATGCSEDAARAAAKK